MIRVRALAGRSSLGKTDGMPRGISAVPKFPIPPALKTNRFALPKLQSDAVPELLDFSTVAAHFELQEGRDIDDADLTHRSALYASEEKFLPSEAMGVNRDTWLRGDVGLELL